MSTVRRTVPTELDAYEAERLHSLFDGRAKHRVTSDYDPTSQDKPRRARITLATFQPDYLR